MALSSVKNHPPMTERPARRFLHRGGEPDRAARNTGVSLLAYWGDVMYAARSLRRSPAFTTLATATLAIGIGAITASAALTSQVLLGPLMGVAAPNELVLVVFEREPGRATGISFPNFTDLRQSISPFADLAGYSPVTLHLAPPGDAALRIDGAIVTGDYFGLLGVRANRGRFFTADELRLGGDAHVAVLSHALWTSAFGSAADVIGTRIELNGTRFTIIGIAAPGFRGTERLQPFDVWVPATAYPRLRYLPTLDLSDRRPGVIQAVLGRLAQGTTQEIVEERLRLTMGDLAKRYPEANEIYRTFVPSVYVEIDLPVGVRGRLRKLARLLFGLAGLVLVVSCVNVASMLLLRGVRGRGDRALRYALGASPARLVSLATAEACLLAVGGSAGGLLIALWLTFMLRGTTVLELPPIGRASLNAPTLIVASSLALLVAIACGLVSFSAMRKDRVADQLHAAAQHHTRVVSRVFGALVVAQIAMSCVLAVGALLFERTLQNLNRVPLGFEPRDVLVFGIDPAVQGYSRPRGRVLAGELLRSVHSLPGVQSATLAASLPFAGTYRELDVRSEGATESRALTLSLGFFVQPGYFETLGIPVLLGRDFTATETTDLLNEQGQVAILSESLAQELFGERDPLGQRVVEGEGARERAHTVIGVVGDVRATQLRGEHEAAMYRPFAASFGSEVFVLIRSGLPKVELERRLREQLADLDPSLPPFRVESLTESVARATAEERIVALVVRTLALLAAALAAVGLYSVLAYMVAGRTREIGLRMALGARRGNVIRVVACDAALLIGVGALLGLVSSATATRLIESRLFGVGRMDPASYVTVLLIMCLVGVCASLAPIRAAVSVDPVEALRHD